MTAPDDHGAQLARIEGKIDLQNERLETANRLAEERHSGLKDDIADLRQGHHRLSNRVGVLEADKHVREGERKGISLGGRVMWGGISLLAGRGAGAAILKLVGG